MDRDLFRLFVEIADSRSMSAAALNLGVTRSNTSHRLKMLERDTRAVHDQSSRPWVHLRIAKVWG
ncbi:helix-turn-helix domain-containing protein [Paraburkholderia steynii]|uniref:helix-turn-helix domain-containing protein n=1 Tax=Paraburkholderia steynii TaxID=1245441 RepID=UPI000B8A589F|nr:LysR family transcriptional regulator [Paraburkholderia steynii]